MSNAIPEPNGEKKTLALSGQDALAKYTYYLSLVREKKPGEMYSYDATTREGAEMHLAATLMECDDLASLVNTDIMVANFLIHDATSTEEDGEIKNFKRLVIFDAEGKAYSCGSEGVAKSLAVMFPIRGLMPWIPPVKCKVKMTKLTGTRQWMTLQPDLDSIFRKSK